MVTIRDATERDLPEIFAIYHEQVLRGTATFDTEPRTAAQQAEWLARHRDPRHPAVVAVDGVGEVVGWGAVSAWSDRCAYNRTGEVSFYVREDRRGHGIGRALMREVVARVGAAGVCVLVARIVEGNPASLRLHEAAGFKTIGVMRRVGEKFGRIHDVRLLDLHLDGGGDR